jgi:hypothetical protein
MVKVLRVLVAAISALLLLAGLFAVAGGGATIVTGVWLLVMGAVGLLAVTFERMRYRSAAAELSGEQAGGSGADSGPPDPRFQPTEERFIDPTTRQRLRVWIDARSGERRYRPDE